MAGGLEVFFIDGGVTVSAIASAAAVKLGLKEHARDEKQLAHPEELGQLRATLQKAHGIVDCEHGALTDVWGEPLSLFDERSVASANEAGVPAWAVACVRKAQGLIDEAATLGDRADVYEAQLQVAERDGAGLLREPVSQLVEQLTEMSHRLSVHVPYLRKARSAFNCPADYQNEQLADSSPRPAEVASRDTIGDTVASGDAEEPPEASMRILRERGRFGMAYGSVLKAADVSVKAADASLKAVVEISASGYKALKPLPASEGKPCSSASTDIEFCPYVLDYMEPTLAQSLT